MAQRSRIPRELRPQPGPHPLDPKGKWFSFEILAFDRSVARVKADGRDYALVMGRRHWRADKDGYVVTSVWLTDEDRSIRLALHRLVTNAPAGVLVDHRYGTKLDVRRCMLRFATHSQNSANTRRRRRRDCSSRFRGVTLHKGGKWQAKAEHMGRLVYGGLHQTEEEAALVYNRLAKRIWGRFAQINRIRKLGSSRIRRRIA